MLCVLSSNTVGGVRTFPRIFADFNTLTSASDPITAMLTHGLEQLATNINVIFLQREMSKGDF